MKTLEIRNKQKQETAKEIVDMIYDRYEYFERESKEDFMNAITSRIEREFLLK